MASVLTRPMSAHLVATYGARNGRPMVPAFDDITTIEPPPAA